MMCAFSTHITFRLLANIPAHIIKQMQKLKEAEIETFSSKMTEFTLISKIVIVIFKP
jgi:hypothetical protein